MLYKVSYGNTTRKGAFNCVKTEIYDYEGSSGELRSALLPSTHGLFEVSVEQVKPIQLEYSPRQIGEQTSSYMSDGYYIDITTNIDKIATPEQATEIKEFAKKMVENKKRLAIIAKEHYSKYLCFSGVESASMGGDNYNLIQLRIRMTNAIKYISN